MMKLAVTRCKNPSCNVLYEAAVEDEAIGAACPLCGQINGIDNISPIPLTGRCERCGRPLDDHFRNPTRDLNDYECKR